MRKIIVSLIASLAIISCQRSEGGNDLQDPKEITKADVSFVNYSKLLKERSLTSRMEVDGGGVGFEFTLGRKSRDCRGFGVCELTAFWIEIYGKKNF